MTEYRCLVCNKRITLPEDLANGMGKYCQLKSGFAVVEQLNLLDKVDNIGDIKRKPRQSARPPITRVGL